MADNRGKRIVLLSQELGCFVEEANRLYSMAEDENKMDMIDDILNRGGL